MLYVNTTHNIKLQLPNRPDKEETYLLTHLLTYSLTYLLTYLLAYLLTDLHNYLHIHLLTHLLSHLFTYFYLLMPYSRVLPEKLTGFQLFKKFSTFCGTWRLITTFTSAHCLSLSWASSIQSIPSHDKEENNVRRGATNDTMLPNTCCWR